MERRMEGACREAVPTPSWGPGEIPPQPLSIQQARHASLPTFPGPRQAGGKALTPVPGGS